MVRQGHYLGSFDTGEYLKTIKGNAMSDEKEKPSELVPSNEILKGINQINAMKTEMVGLVEKSKDLTIAGHVGGEKEGFKLCDKSRLVLKDRRCNIEATRKKLKSYVLQAGKDIDGTAAEITKIIEPEEKRLQKLCDEYELKIKQEKERLEKEAAEKLQGRVNFLQAFDAIIDLVRIQAASDEEFAYMVKEASEIKAKKDEEAAKEKKKQDEIIEHEKQSKLASEKAENDLKKMLVGARQQVINIIGYFGDIYATEEQLATMTDKEFDSHIDKIRQAIVDREKLYQKPACMESKEEFPDPELKEFPESGLFTPQAQEVTDDNFQAVNNIPLGSIPVANNQENNLYKEPNDEHVWVNMVVLKALVNFNQYIKTEMEKENMKQSTRNFFVGLMEQVSATVEVEFRKLVGA